MELKEKLWREELKRLADAPTEPVKPSMANRILKLMTIVTLVVVPMLLIYSHDNRQLKAELKRIQAEQFTPSPVMQPVIFSPYTIQQPGDACEEHELLTSVFGHNECWGA